MRQQTIQTKIYINQMPFTTLIVQITVEGKHTTLYTRLHVSKTRLTQS